MSSQINLMSDTVTLPTEEMRKAMYEAEVGDDVSGADPTINKLEQLVAEMTGKEASLYMPSGTMANLVALLSHCPAGQEVFVEENSHIYGSEGGGISRVAGLIPRQIRSNHGIMNPDDIRNSIRHANVHYAKPGLICVENTHNFGGGTVYPLETLKEIRAIADEHHLKFHMDGARVFNAAAYLDVDVKEIVKYVDSFMFCLSKGLSAPVGSMLCGTKEFIAEALRNRKMLGGGLRQSGILAAAGIVSLKEMTARLKDDHKNAHKLAEGLNNNSHIAINMECVQTNILFMNVSGPKDAFYLGKELKEKYSVLCDVRNNSLVRMVTNRHISKENVDYVVDCVNKILV